MDQPLFRPFLLVIALLVAAPQAASADAISKAMGNLRWGMSDVEVATVLKHKIKKVYTGKIKRAKGAKKRQLQNEAKKQLRALDNVVHFDGSRTRWDSSAIADEYTHGNGESVLVVDEGDAHNYYFFIEDRLWKWVKAYPAATFGGSNFKRFQGKLRKRFGKGHEKEGAYYRGSKQQYQWVEYLNRQTRLRGVDKTSNYGQYALVFEEMDTVRSLSSYRVNNGRKTSPRLSALAKKAERGGGDDGIRRGRAPARGIRRGNKRSIMGDSGDETQAEYEARKKRVLAEKKRKQREMYERKQEAKKGKVLDDLAGLDSDDPIDGMH